jgi:hypothetical protein
MLIETITYGTMYLILNASKNSEINQTRIKKMSKFLDKK